MHIPSDYWRNTSNFVFLPFSLVEILENYSNMFSLTHAKYLEKIYSGYIKHLGKRRNNYVMAQMIIHVYF